MINSFEQEDMKLDKWENKMRIFLPCIDPEAVSTDQQTIIDDVFGFQPNNESLVLPSAPTD